jgi:DNA repair protein RadC
MAFIGYALDNLSMRSEARTRTRRNHTRSGDPPSSPDDILLTQRLVSPGELLGVSRLDLIIS